MTGTPEGLETLLRSLREILAACHGLDPRPFIFASRRPLLTTELADPLVALLDRALERLSAIEGLCGAEDERAGEDWEMFIGPEAIRPPDSPVLGAMLWRQVADFSFTSRIELRRCVQWVAQTRKRHEDLLVACESAQRKLKRALLAVLEAAARAGAAAPALVSRRDHDVEAGLAVRRLFAKFRQSLVPCQPSQPESVRRAVRYAAVSLAVLFGSGDFSEVRAADRLTLMSLQARVLDWARGGAELGAGARLCQDISAVAELLAAINKRQELRLHDAELVDELLISPPPTADDQGFLSWVGRMRGLQGYDDALDGLLRRAYRGEVGEELGHRLVVALNTIQHQLGG